MKASTVIRIISFIIATIVFFKCDTKTSGLILSAIAAFNYGLIRSERKTNE